jgi:hypothetical protein
MGQLLKEILAMSSWDVLQPAQVSPKIERRGSLLDFPRTFLGSLMSSLFLTFYAAPSPGCD